MRKFVLFYLYFTCFNILGVVGVCEWDVLNTTNISEMCLEQLHILCNDEELLFQLWDSSSRILHSGLLVTNNQDLGNYDACVSIDVTKGNSNVRILGKFCPYSWFTEIPKALLQELVAKMELFEFRPFNIETTTDANNNSIILTGSLCIPNQCTIDEFTKVFHAYPFPVKYYESFECVTSESTWSFSTFETVVTICFLVIFAVVITSTLVDIAFYYTGKGEPHDLLRAFSIMYNGNKLLTISDNRVDQIQCMHGLRFLCMCWVIAGHTFAALSAVPQFNKKFSEEFTSHLYSQYILAAVYAVDTFFFLSGFLFSYLYLKQSEGGSVRTQFQRIPLLYLHRFLRLTPAVGALFFISLSFLKVLGDGPLWFDYLNILTQPCRDYWWRYFLYIQNYSADHLCFTHTWYLSADMQMFLVAPFVMIPTALYFRRRLHLVLSGLCSLVVVCIGITIALQFYKFDSTTGYHTHASLSDYLVGIAAGLIFHQVKGKRIKINKGINLFTWCIVLTLMFISMLHLNKILNQSDDHTKHIVYYALHKPIWSLCIAWIVISCYLGYGGIIDCFLSHPAFQVGSKLSYSMYIVHGLVISVMTGKNRTYVYTDNYIQINHVLSNIVMSFFISLLWYLCFESPMILLDKMLFDWIGSLGVKGQKKPQSVTDDRSNYKKESA